MHHTTQDGSTILLYLPRYPQVHRVNCRQAVYRYFLRKKKSGKCSYCSNICQYDRDSQKTYLFISKISASSSFWCTSQNATLRTSVSRHNISKYGFSVIQPLGSLVTSCLTSRQQRRSSTGSVGILTQFPQVHLKMNVPVYQRRRSTVFDNAVEKLTNEHCPQDRLEAENCHRCSVPHYYPNCQVWTRGDWEHRSKD